MPCRARCPNFGAARSRGALGRDVLVRRGGRTGPRRRRPRGAVGALPPLFDGFLPAAPDAGPRQRRFGGRRARRRCARGRARTCARIADERGRLPLIGDDDGGQLFRFGDRAPADASATSAPRPRSCATPRWPVRPPSKDVFWMLGKRPDAGLRVARRALAVTVCRDSGYLVSRMPEAGISSSTRARTGSSTAVTRTPMRWRSCSLSAASRCSSIPAPRPTRWTPELRDRFRSSRHAQHAGPRRPRSFRAAGTLPLGLARRRAVPGRVHRARTGLRGRHPRRLRSGAAHARGPGAARLRLADRRSRRGRRTPVVADAWWHLHPAWRATVSDSYGRAAPRSGAATRARQHGRGDRRPSQDPRSVRIRARIRTSRELDHAAGATARIRRVRHRHLHPRIRVPEPAAGHRGSTGDDGRAGMGAARVRHPCGPNGAPHRDCVPC